MNNTENMAERALVYTNMREIIDIGNYALADFSIG